MLRYARNDKVRNFVTSTVAERSLKDFSAALRSLEMTLFVLRLGDRPQKNKSDFLGLPEKGLIIEFAQHGLSKEVRYKRMRRSAVLRLGDIRYLL